MRKLLMMAALFVVAGLIVGPAALAQEDDVTVQEGPPLTALPTATATVHTGPPLTPLPEATNTPTSTATPSATVTATPTPKGATLPKTGGPSGLALLAGALLVGGGVTSFALVRRR
jgi:LPXTG-motif cell wall-anchored protein